MLATNASLEALCGKIEEGNAEQLACLQDIKAALAEVLTALETLTDISASLEAICEKLDAANASLEALCDKLDAILAAVVAQTAILTAIEGNQTGMSCDEPTHVTTCDPQPTIEECCTGGATAETAVCYNVRLSWFTGNQGTFDRCTYSIGGVDLPDDNYTRADFEAAFPAGTTFEDQGDTVRVCTSEGFSMCYNRACFNGNIGQLTRACVVGSPNTAEEECIDVIRTFGKYEEPIGNLLATQNDILEDMLEKMCEDAGACSNSPIVGNWCDITVSAEPEAEDVINASNILVFVETCGAEQTLQYFTAGANGELVPYTPVAEIVDCDTYQPPMPEPPECPDGAVFEQVCIPPNSYGILDNSTWVGAPLNHLQNGSAYEITLTHEDGSTTVLPILSDPYYRGFRAAVEATLPECKVVYVCANHTSPRGCNAAHVGNLAAYPAYDAPTFPGDIQNNLTNPAVSELWASGWLLDCAGCESPIVNAEITGSSDPAWIGANKDIINYKGDEQILFRAITCDGVFWKDCDGNDMAAPVGGCCAKPCDSSSELLDLLNDVKRSKSTGLEDANYDGAIALTRGRPDPTVAWELLDNRDGLATGHPVVASGATWQEFVDDLESKGFSEFSEGEIHYVCPCPPGLVQAGDYFVNAAGETQTKPACTPSAELANFPAGKVIPEDECVLAVEECNSDAILNALLAQGDDAAMSAAKLCLIEEHLNPAGPCGAPVVTLDKEAQVLTLQGDVTANYSAGQAINLQNANGEACGDATVAEGEGNVTLVEGNTVIRIVECELEEGKTPVQITQATPIAAPVKAAIATIKTLQLKKATLVRKEVAVTEKG